MPTAPPTRMGTRSRTDAPERVKIAAAVTRTRAAVIPAASRGLLRPMMPIAMATITSVIPIPTVRAILSLSPKVSMAKFFNHSGVNWMKVWPSEFNGDAGALSTPIHRPNAASSSAIPMASPIAMRPTRPATAIPGRQARGPCGGMLSAVVVGRSLVVMSRVRGPPAFGWAECGETFAGCRCVGSVTLLSSAQPPWNGPPVTLL
jgi:hypothetical protein